MDGQAIIAVGTAVMAATQLTKWSGIPRPRAPFIVMALSALGVLLWIYAHGDIRRELAFDYFAAWIAVATSAAGVYDFADAGADGVRRKRSDRGRGATSADGSSALERTHPSRRADG